MLGSEEPIGKPSNNEYIALQREDAAPQPVEDFNFSSLTIDLTHKQS